MVSNPVSTAEPFGSKEQFPICGCTVDPNQTLWDTNNTKSHEYEKDICREKEG